MVPEAQHSNTSFLIPSSMYEKYKGIKDCTETNANKTTALLSLTEKYQCVLFNYFI